MHDPVLVRILTAGGIDPMEEDADWDVAERGTVWKNENLPSPKKKFREINFFRINVDFMEKILIFP